MNHRPSHPFQLTVLAFVAVAMTGLARASERQVPLDAAGSIMMITPEIEATVHQFDGFPDFRKATLLLVDDTSFVLEVTYLANSVPRTDRLPRTHEEVTAMRREVTIRLGHLHTEPPVNQEGRDALITSASSLALGFWGWAVPVSFGMLDNPDAKSFVGVYLLISGATFITTSFATGDAEVTTADATLATIGGTLGIAHGIMLSSLVGANPIDGSNAALKAACGISTLASIGELYGGYVFAKRMRLSEGGANVIGTGAILGTVDALALTYLSSDNPSPRLVGGLGLLGGLSGVVATSMLNISPQFSTGDYTVLVTTTCMGTFIMLANTMTIAHGSSVDRLGVGMAVLGNIAGFGIGYALVKDQRISTSDAALTSVGAVAGGAVGVGVASLVSGRHSEPAVYSLLATAGMIGGFALVYGAAPSRNAGPDHSMWNINVNPIGITNAFSHSSNALPVLTLQGRW